jgi:hypothetical protein
MAALHHQHHLPACNTGKYKTGETTAHAHIKDDIYT